MEARLILAAFSLSSALALGAGYRTQNFIVMAPTAPLAREICETAEQQRRDLALEWLGHELPPWRDPCPITATVSPQAGAGGITSFSFERGQPGAWTMSVQGSRERILDSVLPHEVTHTIFATHFGCPLPRWADEGACTTVEDISERRKHDGFLLKFLTTDRGIPFNQMFVMDQYPQDILPLYSQGFSLARFLIDQGGRRKFVDYIEEGLKTKNWTATTRNRYGFTSLSNLQTTWLDWVRKGSPRLTQAGDVGLSEDAAVAMNSEPTAAPVKTDTVRGTLVASAENVNTAPANGWYARQKNQAAGQPGLLMSDRRGRSTQTADAASPPRSRTPEGGRGPYQSTARPQPPEQPKQIILEWSHDPKSATGRPPLQAMPPSPYR